MRAFLRLRHRFGLWLGHDARIVKKPPTPPNLVTRKASFSATADALSVSPAYVSKRVSVLEAEPGTRLLHREKLRAGRDRAYIRVAALRRSAPTQ